MDKCWLENRVCSNQTPGDLFYHTSHIGDFFSLFFNLSFFPFLFFLVIISKGVVRREIVPRCGKEKLNSNIGSLVLVNDNPLFSPNEEHATKRN